MARKRNFIASAPTPIVGMAFSNLIALSIIVTAAATLHAAGKTDIESWRKRRRHAPDRGRVREVIFALGIVGTGLLAIPVLAGATAYAVGEGRRWPVGARAQAEGGGRVLFGAGAVGSHRESRLNFTSINRSRRCTGVR